MEEMPQEYNTHTISIKVCGQPHLLFSSSVKATSSTPQVCDIYVLPNCVLVLREGSDLEQQHTKL